MSAPQFEALGSEVGALVEKKNAAYGDSFAVSGEFLRTLFPDGVPPEKYGDMLAFVRIFDKMKRIATDEGAFGEDPRADIVGYGLLMLARHRAGQTESKRAKGPLPCGCAPGSDCEKCF